MKKTKSYEKDEKKLKKDSYWRDVVERFLCHKLAVVSLILLFFLVAAVIFLPQIIELEPYISDYSAGAYANPSKEHLLGTDSVSRDILARLVYGGRTSLFVGVLSAIISLIIGVPLGLVAGYYRKVVGDIILRLTDLFQSFPSMILVLVMVSVIGPSVTSVTVIIGVLGWARIARTLYSSVIKVCGSEYVEAARAIGTKNLRIMVEYVLPNAFAPVLVTFTFSIASAILTESGLSFLGMGVQPPEASWGNILYAAQSVTVLAAKPWIWIPTGILLSLTVLSFNFVGDGIRDALDPRMKI